MLMAVRNSHTGEVFYLSPAYSRVRRCQRRVKLWAEVIQPFYDRKEEFRLVMITLTYENVEDWRKNDIREFMLKVRAHLQHKLLAYAWVAELQRRGAVHYHVLLLVNRGSNIPHPDEEWWDKGMSKIDTARSPYYVVTYTGKEYQKLMPFPKGLRMFAVWVSDSVASTYQKWFIHLSSLPGWLRDMAIHVQVGAKFRRAPGGGWLVGENFYSSPYQVIGFVT